MKYVKILITEKKMLLIQPSPPQITIEFMRVICAESINGFAIN